MAGLLAVLATSCGEGLTAPPQDPLSVGTLLVRITTTGLDPDPDGYAIGTSPDSIASLRPNGSAVLPLRAGSRFVTLTGQAPNCAPVEPVSRSVTIVPPDTTTLDFTVVCFRDPILFARRNIDRQDDNIWIVDASGGPEVDLTGEVGHSAWFDGNGPALSPDRTKILFSSDRDNTVSTVYVMALNKSSIVRIGQSGVQGEPTWSPDARQVAYFSFGTDETNPTTDIFVANADGTGAHAIVTTTSAWEFNPTWSPDGTHILFERDDSSGDYPYGYLVLAKADGSAQTRLTDGAPSDGYAYAVDAHARWSPDGSRIVFERQEITDGYTAATTDLWMVAPDGSNLVRLTNTPTVQDQYAEWRDDGAVLVWSGCRAGCRLTLGWIVGTPAGDVWQMNADGTGIVNVTNTGTDGQPAWNSSRTFSGKVPPSSFMVITRYEGGVYHLYRVMPDGSEPFRLTTGTMNDLNPQWR